MTRKADIHSVAFLQGWTTADARAWLKKEGLKPIKPVHKVVRADGVMSQLRYRIIDPSKFSHFITKRVEHKGKPINLIIGFY